METSPIRLNSIGSNNSLIITCSLLPAHHNTFIPTTGLVDSGCTSFSFARKAWTVEQNIQCQRLPRPRQVILADGKTAEPLTHYFISQLQIGNHSELAFFFIINLSKDTPLILGIPWLQKHNPHIDWPSMTLMFKSEYCRENCLYEGPFVRRLEEHVTPSLQQLRRMGQSIVSKTSEKHQKRWSGDNFNVRDPKILHSSNPWANINFTCHKRPNGSSRKFRKVPVPGNYKPPSVEDCPEELTLQAHGHGSQYVDFHSNYKPASVDEWSEEETWNDNSEAPELEIHSTLTPSRPFYRTYVKDAGNGPERRGMMIPNQPRLRPVPTTKAAGFRRVMPKPPKEKLAPLSAPVPEVPKQQQFSYDDGVLLGGIRWADANSFVQFCRYPDVSAVRVIWSELDHAAAEEEQPWHRRAPDVPNIDEDIFKDIMLGKGSPRMLYPYFDERYHDFLSECFQPLHLGRVSEADIEKFLAGKKELTQEEMLRALPTWLHDLKEAFEPKHADELPPRRTWDHKIEIKPGEEPPYYKTDRFQFKSYA